MSILQVDSLKYDHNNSIHNYGAYICIVYSWIYGGLFYVF